MDFDIWIAVLFIAFCIAGIICLRDKDFLQWLCDVLT